jgi:thiol-disulfide isomerase/thioredoxin
VVAGHETEAEVMKRSSLSIALALAFVSGAPPPAAAQRLTDLNQHPTLGDTLPALDTQALDGSAKRIDYPKGTTTVLLFFSSSCPVCHRMIPEWNRLYEKRGKGVSIVGVIVDREPPGFFQTMPIAFPVVRIPAGDFAHAHKIRRVPLTLRLAAGGRIEDLGLGVLDPIRLGELFRP